MPDPRSSGIVHLVGAGPGDPGLLTVKGLTLLRRADAVVHDRLIDLALLDEAPEAAQRIDVGKAPGRHSRGQGEINDLLVALGRRGLRVVRLKGGDPFVFGRGGEECEALAAAGVPFEVVPGVSSALAAPACAGIPLTHRGLAGSFTVVTGHRCGEDPAALDWPHLARAETLVVLMGVAQLPEIARRLIEHGRPAETPVAAIHAGSTPAQSVVSGTLADFAAPPVSGRVAGPSARLRAPATIVVGAVAALAQTLASTAFLGGSTEVVLSEIDGITEIGGPTGPPAWLVAPSARRLSPPSRRPERPSPRDPRPADPLGMARFPEDRP
jgi:uroporphyrin-III C-methyltransferase